jgi:hypothetical protein
VGVVINLFVVASGNILVKIFRFRLFLAEVKSVSRVPELVKKTDVFRELLEGLCGQLRVCLDTPGRMPLKRVWQGIPFGFNIQFRKRLRPLALARPDGVLLLGLPALGPLTIPRVNGRKLFNARL